MYKLEFTLKQHTPLIHFQHDQAGATLRASEVKPKLDKFILSQKGLKNVPDFWYSDKEKESLNYKLRFMPVDIKKKHYYTSNPPSPNNKDPKHRQIVDNEFNAEYVGQTQYFANNENLKDFGIKDKEEVRLGTLSDVIRGEFFCYNLSLLGDIESILVNFFLSYNFSCRNSKGFGCFTVININGNKQVFREQDLASQFDVVYKVEQLMNNYNEALKTISDIYKLLKSGKGQREQGGYKKSLLFRYFVSMANPIRWEKRKIKQGIKSKYFKYRKSDGNLTDIELTYTHEPCYELGNFKNWNDLPKPYSYKYIRALLGLAESYEFLADEIESEKFEYYIKVKSNNGIERFKSPITFKYINGVIYICSNSVSPKILNTKTNPVSFNFDKLLKRNNKLQDKPFFITTDYLKNLETPSEFNIGDFLDFAFKRDTEKIDGIISIKNNLIL
ncbi:MAG: hypothetical protein RBS73_08290 [Prolixibacteraceae bacterium]|jgi:YHS domain-containing protein|nr:hypothetical protein [Prolixibacteraceae bacterium]